MAEYTLSAKARKNLQEIGDYTERMWSEEQAVIYLRMLFSQFHQISRLPEAGRKYDYIRPGLWASDCGKHVIFYRILSKKTVRIVRILHRRLDFQRHL